MPEALKRLIQDLLTAWNSHDADQIPGLYTADYEGIDVAYAQPHAGQQGIRQLFIRWWQAFPDLHFTSNSIIVQGNRAVLDWTAQGTHQGTMMNIPPTRRHIQVRGITILTISEGKVQKAVHVWDVAGLLRMIGLLPEL